MGEPTWSEAGHQVRTLADNMSVAEDRTRLAASVGGLLVFKLVINTTQRAIYPFLPAIARGLGVSLAAAGAMVSVRWGTAMATPFIVGTLGRRRSPMFLLVVGALVFTTGSFITALTGVFVGAVIGFALLGIAKPLFDIGAASWVSERVPYARRARSIGVLEVSWAGGLLVGAPLFGWLIDRYDWTSPFLVVGVLTLVGSAVLLAVGRGRWSTDPSAAPAAKLDLDRPAVAFLAAAGAMSVAVELSLVVLGEWLEVGFGLTLLALGGVGTLLGVAELLGEGGVFAFTDRLGPRRALQLATGGMAVGFTALAFVTTSLALGLGALALTILVFEFGIVSAIPLATEIRPGNRAGFLALYMVASSLGRVVADLIGPAVFAAAGFSGVAVGGAVMSAVALAIITRWVRLDASAIAGGSATR